MPKSGGTVSSDLPPLRSSGVRKDEPSPAEPLSLSNPNFVPQNEVSGVTTSSAEVVISTAKPEQETAVEPPKPGTRAAKQFERRQKDSRLLTSEHWLARNGHTISFVCLYLFSVMVLYRPYELVPALGFLASTAFYFALATLAVYLPTQFATEGNVTILSTDVKAILGMAFIAFVTIPIAKDPGTAWESFNEPFIKAVIMFIVLVNVPFSLIGAILALAVTRQSLSLGALVGLVTVFGISARNAILLFAHYEKLLEDSPDSSWTPELIERGAAERLLPVMMTAILTALGLIPLAASLGTAGNEIEGPLAIAVLGGLVSSTVLCLVVLPALMRWIIASRWMRFMHLPTESL